MTYTYKARYSLIGTLLLGFHSLAVHAADHFQTQRGLLANSNPEPHPQLGHQGEMGVSLLGQGLLPLSSPYSTNDAGVTRGFRYANPSQIGAEFSYVIVPHWEMGMTAGYESLKSKVTLNTAAGNTRTQLVESKEWPLMVVLRYLVHTQGWRPEAELGAGLSMGSTVVTEDFSNTALTVSTVSPRVSGSLGVGFPWSEHISFHLYAGGFVTFLDQKTYNQFSDPVTIGSQSGILLKSALRFRF